MVEAGIENGEATHEGENSSVAILIQPAEAPRVLPGVSRRQCAGIGRHVEIVTPDGDPPLAHL